MGENLAGGFARIPEELQELQPPRAQPLLYCASVGSKVTLSCGWAALLCSQGQREPEPSRMDEHEVSPKSIFPSWLKRVTRETCPHAHLRMLRFNRTLFKMNSSRRAHQSATVGKADAWQTKAEWKKAASGAFAAARIHRQGTGQSEQSGFWMFCSIFPSPPRRPWVCSRFLPVNNLSYNAIFPLIHLGNFKHKSCLSAFVHYSEANINKSFIFHE